jgi:hypothetical protein
MTPEERAKRITPCEHADCGLACRKFIAAAISAALVERDRDWRESLRAGGAGWAAKSCAPLRELMREPPKEGT